MANTIKIKKKFLKDITYPIGPNVYRLTTDVQVHPNKIKLFDNPSKDREDWENKDHELNLKKSDRNETQDEIDRNTAEHISFGD